MTKSKKSSSYVAAPEVPAELSERIRAVLDAMTGETYVSEGARKLSVSRNHFQSLVHKATAAVVEALTPKAPGPTPVREQERALSDENERLKKQLARLQRRVQTTERMMMVVSGMLRGKLPSAREVRAVGAKKKEGKDDDEERGARLANVLELRAMGVRSDLAASMCGVDASTVRRWCRGVGAGRERPTRHNTIAPELTQRAREHVRALGGLVGAESLRRTVVGLSRRQASAIKQSTCTEMERERIARCTRVTVMVPGLVRGFDQHHVSTTEGLRTLLLCADAAVPFRTSAQLVERYDDDSVARTLDADFERHGAPLVVRMDRHRAHSAPKTAAVLRRHRVLVLHGPPRLPRFYGQLERQNREHRGWLDAQGQLTPLALERALPTMLGALNSLWRRRTLGFRTARDVWSERPNIDFDRDALHQEVQLRAARFRDQSSFRGRPADFAERLAIEQTLSQHGWLERQAAGWC